MFILNMGNKLKVAIHTVILNELDEYLKTWLDHHTPMVDHIFIFEDIGSHSHKHITDQYQNVTLQSVVDICETEEQKQRFINNKAKGINNQHYYVMYGVLKIQALKQYDWCFTLDIDEFITLQEPYKAIPSVLSEFQDKDGILIQWQNFGANGHVYKPNYNGRDYREFYTKKSPFNKNDAAVKITTKIAWNLNKVTKWNLCGIHCMAGNWVNTQGKMNRKEICYDKMYLSHYVTKSWEEYVWKLYIRGMHCGNRHRSDIDFFEINEDMKERYDELIQIKNKLLNV